jgi:DnaJ like chaperone protein
LDATDLEGDAVTKCGPDPGDVAFTAAVIGLAAKMAKSDGIVTPEEIDAAQKVFRPPAKEEGAFHLTFGVAKQSIHGFESYAKQLGRRYKDRPCLLEDVLDGLFHIARADGRIMNSELAFLARVAELFGFSEAEFRRIKAAHLGPDSEDPFVVLGLLPGASMEEVRAAFRRLAAEHHPDKLLARGAPIEIVRIGQDKMAAINAAFAQIREEFSTEAAPG